MKRSMGMTAGVVWVLAGLSGCTSQDWAYFASALDESNRGSPGYQQVCNWYDVTDSASKEGVSIFYEGICNTEYLTVTNLSDYDYQCEITFSDTRYQRRLPPYGKIELQQARSDHYGWGWDCEGQRLN
ncbi:hypothetical protein [Isoalcanivorax indicus]|uniref:hypothetical protein n=1 Tax=Isoalcanivorax indicus TaxID=2202653 RepID=UPI0013C4FBF9|nr:hypothetical protein [Isoalcanivorax indicus]